MTEEELFISILAAIDGTTVGYKEVGCCYDEEGTVTIHFFNLEKDDENV